MQNAPAACTSGDVIGTKGYRKKSVTVSKYRLQNIHKISIRNAVLHIQIELRWPAGRRT